MPLEVKFDVTSAIVHNLSPLGWTCDFFFTVFRIPIENMLPNKNPHGSCEPVCPLFLQLKAKKSPPRHGSQCCPFHRHAWRYRKHWARLLNPVRNWVTGIDYYREVAKCCKCRKPVDFFIQWQKRAYGENMWSSILVMLEHVDLVFPSSSSATTTLAHNIL